MPSSLDDVQKFIAGTSEKFIADTSVWGLLILATALEMNGEGLSLV